jgi:hypothetical protein
MKRRTFHICVLAILLSLALTGTARAERVSGDIAPPQPPMGSGIQPGQETTQVRMQAETVLIALPSASTSDTWQATVSASFSMHNLGSSAESMQVRFPTYVTSNGAAKDCAQQEFSTYPPIQDFRARVNGAGAAISYEKEAVHDYRNDQDVIVACWATFPATFPAGKDVTIEVGYQVLGQLDGHGVSNYVGFPYILTTGAGWNGTIGSADITLRLPYPADPRNLRDISQGGQIAGNEVRWHFEDFEPQDDIAAFVVNPRIWQVILKDTKTVQANPKDGEAWGRLGKAYKQAFLLERGFREGQAGEQLFQLSDADYRKSLELLPKDADWHYGYASLLCGTAMYREYYADMQLPSTTDLLTGCVQQLKTTLDLKPAYPQALELLQYLESFGAVKMNGSQADYLILTPGVYPSSTPLASPTALAPGASPTALAPGETPTKESSATPAAIAQVTQTPPLTTLEPEASPTALAPGASTSVPAPGASPTADKPNGLLPCGAIFVPLLLLLFIRRAR